MERPQWLFSDGASKEQLWGDVEACAQAADVLFAQLALIVQHLRDDAGSAEDIEQIFLPQPVLIHQELKHLQRGGPRQLVVLLLVVFDQEGEQVGEFGLFGGPRVLILFKLVKSLSIA